ncbi:hypothetical protein Bca101_003817 [Brassica carinata]
MVVLVAARWRSWLYTRFALWRVSCDGTGCNGLGQVGWRQQSSIPCFERRHRLLWNLLVFAALCVSRFEGAFLSGGSWQLVALSARPSSVISLLRSCICLCRVSYVSLLLWLCFLGPSVSLFSASSATSLSQ